MGTIIEGIFVLTGLATIKICWNGLMFVVFVDVVSFVMYSYSSSFEAMLFIFRIAFDLAVF